MARVPSSFQGTIYIGVCLLSLGILRMVWAVYGREPQPAYRPMENESPFIKDVHASNVLKTSPWATRLLFGGWILIVIKSVVVWWACIHYALPIHPMWVVGPTVAFGALCTGVYLFARR